MAETMTQASQMMIGSEGGFDYLKIAEKDGVALGIKPYFERHYSGPYIAGFRLRAAPADLALQNPDSYDQDKETEVTAEQVTSAFPFQWHKQPSGPGRALRASLNVIAVVPNYGDWGMIKKVIEENPVAEKMVGSLFESASVELGTDEAAAFIRNKWLDVINKHIPTTENLQEWATHVKAWASDAGDNVIEVDFSKPS